VVSANVAYHVLFSEALSVLGDSADVLAKEANSGHRSKRDTFTEEERRIAGVRHGGGASIIIIITFIGHALTYSQFTPSLILCSNKPVPHPPQKKSFIEEIAISLLSVNFFFLTHNLFRGGWAKVATWNFHWGHAALEAPPNV